MADVLAVESEAQRRLREWGTKTSSHSEARAAVDRLRTLVQSQTEAWRGRLQAVGGKFATPKTKSPNDKLTIQVPARRGAHTVSATLHEITTTCNHLAFEYAKVHAIAHRFFDRTTADLAEKHMPRLYERRPGSQPARSGCGGVGVNASRPGVSMSVPVVRPRRMRVRAARHAHGGGSVGTAHFHLANGHARAPSQGEQSRFPGWAASGRRRRGGGRSADPISGRYAACDP
jgi:hypothetical protein